MNNFLRSVVKTCIGFVLTNEYSKRALRSSEFDIVDKNRDLVVLRGDEFLHLEKRATELLLPKHLQSLFDLANINCVIDVGANEGQFGFLLRHHGYTGRIVSFEPNKVVFDNLTKLVEQDAEWRVYNWALGSESSSLELNITRRSEFSSLLTPNNKRDTYFEDAASINRTERVDVRRLDECYTELIDEIENPRVFLKIDTQGYDLQVLKGAEHCLAHIYGLQSEVSMLPIYDNMPDYLESFKTFNELGFEMTGLFPVCRSRLRVVEFDCVLIRECVPS